jgi:superfamily II DNA helicase RecQ
MKLRTILLYSASINKINGCYIKLGISCVKWDPRQCHSPSQIVIVTPESVVSKTCGTFLDRIQGLHQLGRFVLDECHAPLDCTPEFRPEMRWLGELVESVEGVWKPSIPKNS